MGEQKRNILILGGSGLLGQHFNRLFTKAGHSVKIASRANTPTTVFWNPTTGEHSPELLENLDIVINLCGVGVADKRWSKQRKEKIISSRVEPAQFFLKICKENNVQPAHYLSASGVNACGYDSIMKDENSPYGNDFLSQVVKKWEESALIFEEICPVSIIRIGFVLTPQKGGLEKMTRPIKLGIGSPIGSGKQIVNWIHYSDVVGVFNHLMTHELTGTFNTTSPNPVTNQALTKEIGRSLGKRTLNINVPTFVIKLIFGEMSEMILKGQVVSVDKILKSGYTFLYSEIQPALNQLWSENETVELNS